MPREGRIHALASSRIIRPDYQTQARLSYAEAGLIAGVGTKQIQNWCSKGILHRYPCGAYRIDASELQRLLHGRIPIRKVKRKTVKKELVQ